MATPTLKARPRTDAETGSRACRRLRTHGEVPVNFYTATGGEQAAVQTQNLAVSAYDLYKLIGQEADIIDLDLGGKVELVQVTEIQRDQFGDDVVHIDLRGINPETPVEVIVKLGFSGRPQGIRDMSLVTLVTRQVTIACKPREIPEIIEVDLSELSAGETLTSGGVKLPAGASLVGNGAAVVATIGKSAGA